MPGKGRPGPECGIVAAISEMAANDAETARLIIDDHEGYAPKLVAQAFTELLRRQDPERRRVSPFTVRWHRRGECRCHGQGEGEAA